METSPGVILVTTDGSPHSRRILPHAAAFARARGDRLMLVHFVDPEKDVAPEPGEEREAAIKRTLEAVAEENETYLRNDGLEGDATAVALGEDESIPDAIVRVAAQHGAVMIAMDTRSHGALHHALHGSTALRVLSETRLPMLLTGAELADAPVAQPHKVIVTSDGSEAAREVAQALGPLLTPGRFAVTLLMVHERDPDAAKESDEVAECRAQLESLRPFFNPDLDIEIVVREIARLGGVDTAILEEARKVGACAIALSSHGTTAARHLFAGNTALTLLGRSPLPLIMARAE